MTTTIPSNPNVMAEIGEKIYAERYRAQFEAEHIGKFVAINIHNGHATLGDTPRQALKDAKDTDPSGFFHLIKVGSAAAIRVRSSPHGKNNRLHR